MCRILLAFPGRIQDEREAGHAHAGQHPRGAEGQAEGGPRLHVGAGGEGLQ